MHKITLQFFLYLILFLETSLCLAKDTSLVIYQRNSFCKLILYSVENHSNNNFYSIESEVNITPLSSINTLGSSGNFAWPSDAANLSTEGLSELREIYIKKIIDNNGLAENDIKLKSIVISIAGYNTNKDNVNIFQNRLIEKLTENNFTFNTKHITYIDDEDFIRQAGLEALKDSCLDKTNYKSIFVSLLSDHAVNYQLFNKKKQSRTDTTFIPNENLTGGYSQLGRDSKKFFINIPEDYTNYDRDNKVLDKIMTSQLNIDLYNKSGDNLGHWLQKDYGRDSTRGLAIMEYILEELPSIKENNESYSDLLQQQTTHLNTYIDESLVKFLDSSITASIDKLNNLVSSNDYAIVFGEFLSNKYIRSKYLTTLNSKIDEQKRRRIIILNDKEFHHALIKASERVNSYNTVNKAECCSCGGVCATLNKNGTFSKDLTKNNLDLIIKMIEQPLFGIGLLSLMQNDGLWPSIKNCPIFENHPSVIYKIR